MKKRFLPLSMLLITMVLAQASLVANAAGIQGKYTPRTGQNATFSSFMKSIRANQETGLIDPADLIAGMKAAKTSTRDLNLTWNECGPDNFGGQTKAVIFDNEGNVLIGTMGGYIYRSTNEGVTFQRIAHVGASISCFLKVGDAIYIGTGDGLDAQDFNVLGEYGYETSFVGNGVFKMVGGNIEQVEGTEDIAFVNEMTAVGNDIYAATNAGLLKNWEVVLEGGFRSVKSNNNGDVLAADAQNVYLMKAGGEFEMITGTEQLPESSDPKVIAMSENDPNYMYIAYLNSEATDNLTGNMYYTDNHGRSWKTGFTAILGEPLYAFFGSSAYHSSFMTVYPNNPKKLLVGSDNLWVLEDSAADTIGAHSYRPIQISEYNCSEFSQVAWNRYYYLHQGIMNIVFENNNPNTFYLGTEGGIFKGEYYSGLYSYKGGNRYFITEDKHTSTARMMSIGVGASTEVLGGCLDHGTLYMTCSENINSVTTGQAVFPHQTANGYASSYFTQKYAGGPCAISTLGQSMYFMSGTGALTTPIYRTETAGEDFDGNFEGGGSSPVIKNSNAFKTPFVLFENYNDPNNPANDLYAPIRTLKHVGDKVYAYSHQAGYPIDYYIKAADATHTDEHGNPCCLPGDTIRDIHDDISTLFLCAIEGKIYMTRDALIFNKATNWFLIKSISGIPTAVALSNDGDLALVGTAAGKLYKVEGLSHAYTEEQASATSATSVVTVTPLNIVTTAIETNKLYQHLDETTGEYVTDSTELVHSSQPISQAITSISIDPRNKHNAIVTLGNYGNAGYIAYITGEGTEFYALSSEINVPAYSSLIEKSSGVIFVGNENGIYYTENGIVEQANSSIEYDSVYTETGRTYIIRTSTTASTSVAWNRTSDITCPVMDIKQATVRNHDNKVDTLYDEAGNTLKITYPGVFNEGMIYAATYGCGIISCANYKEGVDFGITEIGSDASSSVMVYPNPVRGNAYCTFTLKENANVSYQIYDITGKMVIDTELGNYSAGEHTVTLNTEGFANGTYIIRMSAGKHVDTAKFLVY